MVEPEPFAAPLTFARDEIKPRLQLFALRDVTLEAGPLQQARDWNRAYMLRLPNDRLLHNFRITAGLTSSAKPLGGWEDPTCEVAWTFCGALFVGMRASLRSLGRHNHQNQGR
jgi:DUF1680 family protein